MLNLILQDKEKRESQTILFQFLCNQGMDYFNLAQSLFLFQTLTRRNSASIQTINDVQVGEQILG